MSCSLVHQAKTNHSSNLQEAQTTSYCLTPVFCVHIYADKRDCLERAIKAITLGRNSSCIITGACMRNHYGHCNFTAHNGNLFSLSVPAKLMQGQKTIKKKNHLNVVRHIQLG